MENSSMNQFHALSYYTLAHPDTIYFIHQHIVDVYHVQTANENTKPIAITFSLVGLYLYLEKDFTGRQVQMAHMKLAKNKKVWPKFELPNKRGEITVADVLKATPGAMRDTMIKEWCRAVWQSYKKTHETIATLVKSELGI